MGTRYRPAIVPECSGPAPFVVCTECIVAVDDTEEARALHDNYHDYYLNDGAVTR